MSLFDRLFAFRQNEVRSPFEDFLTELLAEWLRQVTRSGRIAEVLKGLFKLKQSQLGDHANLNDLVWETQHVIGPGHRATGKRPDLIGRGPDFFLIIENKVAAGFTQHKDTLGAADQLSLYESYRHDRTESFGGLVLITHSTLPPSEWNHETIYWRSVERYLRAFANDCPTLEYTALDYITRQLASFLGENAMSGTRIALEDITAYPAYQRLIAGLFGLGRIADNRLKVSLHKVELQQLKAPHGAGIGYFAAPEFFGSALSNGGNKMHNAYLTLWSGIVAGEIYDYVKPATAGIPDLSVGIGAWCIEPITEEDISFLNELLGRLNRHSAIPWDLDVYQRIGNGPVILMSARRSLIDVHVQAVDGDLDDIAGEFFLLHCSALLQELSTTLPESDLTVDQLLFDLTSA
ncbi:hypothetical protein SAMN05444507_105100 [Pseudomonas syringae]|uniref:PD-(D/E)XK nuclease superfamily protein n=2 Tax=Pseudomonas syringae TaxID=317 RepID=A0AB74A888_PSESX|nr:hypothetical protein [Pseudomonas syringae]ALU61826.1 hypothetical protein ACA40_18890 [Pseudomonas syringae pv. lapsa]KPX64388.1 Uncharacterized protein ALO39_00319 [Pseudomonas syringae pv. lapsa]MBS7419473.1 hypothetical protein [Pseudomonas syringae]POQ01653.1 hypothetical protein CXB42_21050 [Pseudomonas syringae pv. syringae]RML18072.1 hypothetical protein ALQ99_02164 [Pseudomonas syringae pv. lapsa]